MLENDFKARMSKCPWCGAKNDGAAAIDGEKGPRPGDFTICSRCVNLLVFDEDMTLLKGTSEDLEKLSFDTRVLIDNTVDQLKQFRKEQGSQTK